MLSPGGVDVSSCGLKKRDSGLDYAYLAESHYITINSLTKLVNSRLGVIRFLANGEMGDLDHQQLMEQFNEIDNDKIIDVGSGFILAVLIQLYIFPFFGLYPTILDSIGIALIFTGVSITRSWLWRLLFKKVSVYKS